MFHTTKYSICREEIEALSEIAHQINHKLNADVNSNVAHQQSNESVDLDNLFAFLSEVTPNNSNSNNSNTSSSTSSNNGNENDHVKNNGNNNNNTSIIDDIEETFHDLDVELENVLQQEMEIMENERSNKCSMNAKMGVPSLPEPTTRPPPPPNVPKTVPNAISTNSPMGLNVVDLSTEVIPLSKPPQKPISVKPTKRKEEPIYEAVIPRHELPPVVEMPEPVINSFEPNQKLRLVNGFESIKIFFLFVNKFVCIFKKNAYCILFKFS